MISMAKRPLAPTPVLARYVAVMIMAAALTTGATAAAQSGSRQDPTPQSKLHDLFTLLADPKAGELLTLLADPKIQEWLERQGEAKTAENATTGSTQETRNSVGDSFENRFETIQLGGEQARESGPIIPILGTPVFDEHYLNSSAGAIHRQIVALARAVPVATRLPKMNSPPKD